MPAKPTRLDARLFSGSDELVYLCLPDWFRNTLLSLTERLTWSRVWLNEDWSDYSLTSEDKDRIEYGIWQLTRDDCGCEDLEMLDEIISRIEELENMNINVNCGCGCGCGDSKQPEIVEGIDLDSLCPPPEQDETAPPQADIASKCNLANYLIVQLRTTLINLWNRTQTYQEYFDWWRDLFGFLPTALVVGTTYDTYVAVSQWLTGRSVEWITSNFDPLFNEMVCALYSASSPASAAAGVATVLDKLPFPLNSAAKTIAQRLPYSALFSGSIVSPPGFTNRECCGSVPAPGGIEPLPESPAGYFWASLETAEFVTVPNAGSGTVAYDAASGRFTMSPLTGQVFHEVDVNVDISLLVDRMSALSAHAYYIQIVDKPAVANNGNDGLSIEAAGGGSMLHGHAQEPRLHFDNAEYANETDFSDFVDIFPLTSTFGNGPMSDNQASFRMQSYTANGATIKAVITYLLKA